MLVNPVSITRMDFEGRVLDEIQAVRSSTSCALSPSDSFPQSSWVRRTHHLYDDAGHTTATHTYHKIPASGAGQVAEGGAGTNYEETTFGYDALGVQNRVQTPGATMIAARPQCARRR